MKTVSSTWCMVLLGAGLGFSNPVLADIYVLSEDSGAVALSNIPDDSRYEILLSSPSPDAAAQTVDAPPPVSAMRTLPYGAIVEETARANDLEAALLHAVIRTESAHNPRAVSSKGAQGLMQLMPATARRYGVSDIYDPADNVRGGARYLSHLLKLFNNDVRLTLAAYNAGENAVAKYGNKIPPYRETTKYVDMVMKLYNQYRLTLN